MSHTPHELAEEFPEFVDTIHSLGKMNAHFSKLADEYHTLNRSIHRAETNVEPTDDLHLVDMRKQRMVLKDEIYKILNTNSAG